MTKANKFDKEKIKDLLRLFYAESKLMILNGWNNEKYIDNLLDTLFIGRGVIYLKEDVGVIMGIITPTIWCDKTLQLSELAWYVKPEYRNTSIGYRLLKAYIEEGKRLKESGRIKFFTISKMVDSPDIKYQKFGFSKLDETWVQ